MVNIVYKCDKCSTNFLSNNNLEKHLNRIVPCGTIIQCKRCTVIFKKYVHLTNHLARKNPCKLIIIKKSDLEIRLEIEEKKNARFDAIIKADKYKISNKNLLEKSKNNSKLLLLQAKNDNMILTIQNNNNNKTLLEQAKLLTIQTKNNNKNLLEQAKNENKLLTIQTKIEGSLQLEDKKTERKAITATIANNRVIEQKKAEATKKANRLKTLETNAIKKMETYIKNNKTECNSTKLIDELQNMLYDDKLNFEDIFNEFESMEKTSTMLLKFIINNLEYPQNTNLFRISEIDKYYAILMVSGIKQIQQVDFKHFVLPIANDYILQICVCFQTLRMGINNKNDINDKNNNSRITINNYMKITHKQVKNSGQVVVKKKNKLVEVELEEDNKYNKDIKNIVDNAILTF